MIERLVSTRIPTKHGEFTLHAYQGPQNSITHLAMVYGRLEKTAAPLVRIHSECLTGDLFGSLRCDCGQQLEAAMAAMQQEGSGVLLYLRQEGRGIGLINNNTFANFRLGTGAGPRYIKGLGNVPIN